MYAPGDQIKTPTHARFDAMTLECKGVFSEHDLDPSSTVHGEIVAKISSRHAPKCYDPRLHDLSPVECKLSKVGPDPECELYYESESKPLERARSAVRAFFVSKLKSRLSRVISSPGGLEFRLDDARGISEAVAEMPPGTRRGDQAFVLPGSSGAEPIAAFAGDIIDLHDRWAEARQAELERCHDALAWSDTAGIDELTEYNKGVY